MDEDIIGKKEVEAEEFKEFWGTEEVSNKEDDEDPEEGRGPFSGA